MAVRVLVACLTLCGCLSGQELSLQQYVQRLKTAPGANVADKVEFLSSMGVTLSSQGSRELERAASSTRKNSPIRQPATPSYGRTENSWSVSESTPSADFNRDWNSSKTRIGQYDYYTSSNGVSGTSNRIGNYTYHNFNNGVSGTSSDVGNYRYHNFNNGVNGTTNRVGQYDYHSFNNGVSGASNRIGNFTYHNYNDGTRCVSTKIGNQTNTNCNK